MLGTHLAVPDHLDLDLEQGSREPKIAPAGRRDIGATYGSMWGKPRNPSTLPTLQHQLSSAPLTDTRMPRVLGLVGGCAEFTEFDRPRRWHIVEGPYPTDGTWTFEPDGNRGTASFMAGGKPRGLARRGAAGRLLCQRERSPFVDEFKTPAIERQQRPARRRPRSARGPNRSRATLRLAPAGCCLPNLEVVLMGALRLDGEPGAARGPVDVLFRRGGGRRSGTRRSRPLRAL